MLKGLRLQLTLVYTLAALVVVALVGGGAYLIVARYFAGVTDLALQHKMAHEFHALAAPLPAELVPADRDWSLVRAEWGLLPAPAPRDRTDDDDDDASQSSMILAGTADAAELAAIIVLPLDASGRVLFHPDTTAPILAPDPAALAVALQTGHDLRTIRTTDGRRVRLLTYRLTRPDGPTALQLGRELGDQDLVLNQLTAGLLILAVMSMALVGATSWWLAGRALQPAQVAWERQQRFVASASHELRTPLTLIRASTEVALRSLPADQTDQRELLGDVLAESDHMRRLVDDLLTLSRLDSGQLSLSPTRVVLADLFPELDRQLGRLGHERGVSVSLPPPVGVVWADPDRLHQVLLILVDNALRHTTPGGTITVTGTATPEQIRLSVTDTGSGIAPEHLPHIFERFYRADPARGRSGGNAGLGLSIAQGLIRAMGGQIGVQSQLGQGTTVWFTLPTA
ncbi:MAG: sensor histidine kinase [Oscillochloridaceae bacterium umkhey_bin13]